MNPFCNKAVTWQYVEQAKCFEYFLDALCFFVYYFFITFKTFKIVFYICVWLKYKNVQDLTDICQQNSVCDQQKD